MFAIAAALLVLGGVIAGVILGDSDEGDAGSTAESTFESSGRSTSTSTSSLPTTTVVMEPFERWQQLTLENPSFSPIPADEVPSIAANLCDNAVSDFTFLLETTLLIGDTPLDEAQSKGLIVAAYCPAQLLQLEEAMRQQGVDPNLLAVGSDDN